MLIEKSEMTLLKSRNIDDVGEIFEWRGKLLRGIYPSAAPLVRSLWESGFLEELINKGLFPRSRITEYENEDYAFIVEHARLWPVVYPNEWSFSMLQDAALAVLEVANTAMKFGFNMKDCHGYNIIFTNGRPVYIDLGSFTHNTNEALAWDAYEEFLKFFHYPLALWSKGISFARALLIPGNILTHRDYYILNSRFPGHFSERTVDRVFFGLARLLRMDKQTVKTKRSTVRAIHKTVHWIQRTAYTTLGVSISECCNLKKLRTKILKLKRPSRKTAWGEYHSKAALSNQTIERFDTLIDLIKQYCLNSDSAIDIAGNQGLFAKALLGKTSITRVVCQDYDEQAIDLGYTKKYNKSISFACFDALSPLIITGFNLPNERMKSDIVISLALTHHLILSQGYDIAFIFSVLSSYSDKYICVEFMPKGLWVPGASVNTPPWYTEEWFSSVFKQFFKLLHKEQISENRIVLIGEKK